MSQFWAIQVKTGHLRDGRTCQEDKFLTFCEVRSAREDAQNQSQFENLNFKSPVVERTCQEDKILTFWEVRLSLESSQSKLHSAILIMLA